MNIIISISIIGYIPEKIKGWRHKKMSSPTKARPICNRASYLDLGSRAVPLPG